MRKWLGGFDWLPLTIAALVMVLGFNILSWLGFPASTATPTRQSIEVSWPHADSWVAIFTFTLTLSTIALWLSTASLAREARDSAATLITIESPYVTGGGDFVNTNGVELFRLDVENHGKTPAFMTAYDLQFAKLAKLIAEPTVRPVQPNFRHMDGISPTGARKRIFTQIPMPPNTDIVFGAVWYEDPIRGEEHFSRFMLRINATRDIPGEGLTRLNVEGVSREYWTWDYRRDQIS
jgi:hypothetical protein